MSDFKAKMHQIRNSISAGALPQIPLGELTTLPQTAWLYLMVSNSTGREEAERGEGKTDGKRRRKEERGKGKGKRKERRGKEICQTNVKLLPTHL